MKKDVRCTMYRLSPADGGYGCSGGTCPPLAGVRGWTAELYKDGNVSMTSGQLLLTAIADCRLPSAAFLVPLNPLVLPDIFPKFQRNDQLMRSC